MTSIDNAISLDSFPDNFNIASSNDEILSKTDPGTCRKYVYNQFATYLENGMEYFYVDFTGFSPDEKRIVMEKVAAKFDAIFYLRPIIFDNNPHFPSDILPKLELINGKTLVTKYNINDFIQSVNETEEENQYIDNRRPRSRPKAKSIKSVPNNIFSILDTFHIVDGISTKFEQAVKRYQLYPTAERFIIALTDNFKYNICLTNTKGSAYCKKMLWKN